jgi:steroid 5-alpha reductase family enzyme
MSLPGDGKQFDNHNSVPDIEGKCPELKRCTEILKKGFLAEGLWKNVRHPNFASNSYLDQFYLSALRVSNG